MIKQLFKMLFYILSVLILTTIIGAIIFLNTSPEFGGKHSLDDKLRYSKTGFYSEGKFSNLTETKMEMGVDKIFKLLGLYIKGTPNSKPSKETPVEDFVPKSIQDDSLAQFMWFGHSAFYVKIGKKNILIDPMLGDVPAPNPLLGQKRYQSKLPVEIEELPNIDIILISHDHYDHLDYGSIQKLKSKTGHFYVPMGVGAHFRAWGVPEKNITEMAWWEETYIDDLKITFTPSRHFSGRGLFDRWSTLWGAWIIKTPFESIFFSGDSGYGNHFEEIGQKYGPFDLAFMECGQYNEMWSEIHMMPEETAQAALDLKANKFMPIHWGSFTLALHSWTDPIERVSKAAQNNNQTLITPKIGDVFTSASDNTEKWWEL